MSLKKLERQKNFLRFNWKFLFIFLGIVLFLKFVFSYNYDLNGISNSFSTNISINYTRTPHTNSTDFAHLNISDTDLILYTPFDILENSANKTFDYTNKSNDGLLSGGVSFNFSGGIYGSGSYYFDGIDDGIVSNSSGYNNITGTISIWVKKSEQTNQGIFTSYYASNNKYVIYGTSLGDVRLVASNPVDGGETVLISSSIGLDEWFHLAVTYDFQNDEYRMYINGVLNDSDVSTDYNASVLPSELKIGRDNSVGSFNGSLDEVMVWNRALSQVEIEQIYNSTYKRFYSAGELLFKNLNFESNSSLNISLDNCQTFNGSYFQGRINNGSYENFSNCSIVNYDLSGINNLGDANLTINFISSANGFYSPFLMENYTTRSGTIVNSSDNRFSQAYELIWPPMNQTDSCSGAECNPTGDPIGGFKNYSRLINFSDAYYYINTKEELIDAILNAVSGDIIYINDSVTLDFTNDDSLIISAPNITIASGRGSENSLGALIIKNRKEDKSSSSITLFKVHSENVRITGLRFYGGDLDCSLETAAAANSGKHNLPNSYTLLPSSDAILSNASYLEVDNSEFYGWRHSSVHLSDGAKNNYVHHNYIHDNCRNGLGYGVLVGNGNGISVLIEANLFNHNRHSIASSNYNNSYEARYNLDMGESIGGHNFDRHGNPGGNYTVIHHNSFLSIDDYCSQTSKIVIRDSPIFEDGAQIYNNWFQCGYIYRAVTTFDYTFGTPYDLPPNWGTNVTVWNNFLNITQNPQFYPPVPIISLNKSIVSINESILFDASSSYKTGGSIIYVEWDFADNSSLKYGKIVNHSFSESGRYLVRARVSDELGVIREDFVEVVVGPENKSKTYLNFWIFENSEVDSPEYVQKQAKINEEIVWSQNFSDNVSEWQHINVEVPENLINNKNEINLTLGVATLKNYTAPDYPASHEVVFFEVFLDSVTLFIDGEDMNGDGNFENSFWNYFDNSTHKWTNARKFDRRISGLYSNEIAPEYWSNFTEGEFVGIFKTIYLTNKTTSKLLMDGNYYIEDFADSDNRFIFNGIRDYKDNKVVYPEGIFRYFDGSSNYISNEVLNMINESFYLQFVVNDEMKEKPLIYLNNDLNKLYFYLDSSKKLNVRAWKGDVLDYQAVSLSSIPSNVINNLLVFFDGNSFSIYLDNNSLEMSFSGDYSLNFSNESYLYIGRKDFNYFKGLIGGFEIYNYKKSQNEINSFIDSKKMYIAYTFSNELNESENFSGILSNGAFGNAYTFDGKDDYIDFGDNELVKFSKDEDFSFSVWFKLNKILQPIGEGNLYLPFLTKGTGDSSSGAGFGFQVHEYNENNPLLKFRISNNSAYPNTKEIIYFFSGDFDWHHTVVSVDRDGNATMYLDGIQVGTVNVSLWNIDLNNTHDFTIGRESSWWSFFNGSLDEIRIFNRTLDQSEVSSLYSSNSISNGSNLLGYWNFDIDSFYPIDSKGNFVGSLKNHDVSYKNNVTDYSNNKSKNLIFKNNVSYAKADGKRVIEFYNSDSLAKILFDSSEQYFLNNDFSIEYDMKFNNTSGNVFDIGVFSFILSGGTQGNIYDNYFSIKIDRNLSSSNYNESWDIGNYVFFNESSHTSFKRSGNSLMSSSLGGLHSSVFSSENFSINFSSDNINLTIGNLEGYVDYFLVNKRASSEEEDLLKYNSDYSYLECHDFDGDGYGSFYGFGLVNGCNYQEIDCNDVNSEINPGASEINDNGLDDDCDGNFLKSSSDLNFNDGSTGIPVVYMKLLEEGYSVKLFESQKVEISYGNNNSKEIIVKDINVEDYRVIVSVEGKDYEIELFGNIKIDLNDDTGYYVKIMNKNNYGKVSELEFKLISKNIISDFEELEEEEVFIKEDGSHSFWDNFGNFFIDIWKWIRNLFS